MDAGIIVLVVFVAVLVVIFFKNYGPVIKKDQFR